MTFQTHLAIDNEKIQSGVSRIDARNWARRVLEGSSDTHSLDADLVLAFVCGISRLDLLTYPLEPLTSAQVDRFKALVARREKGEPVAYLTSKKEFYGLEFKVSPDVLIPRPDTEVLVEEAAGFIRNQPDPRVIDACTGSGCIAISIAHAIPRAQVVATDLSPQALEIAKENAEALRVNVQFRQGDLLTPCGQEGPVDLIVSNPPYIPASDIPNLMVDVRSFEPHLALQGEGEDGLGMHCRILAQSLNLLRPGGMVLMEIGDGQAEILLKQSFSGFSQVEFLRDYGGVRRVAKYVRIGVFHG